MSLEKKELDPITADPASLRAHVEAHIPANSFQRHRAESILLGIDYLQKGEEGLLVDSLITDDREKQKQLQTAQHELRVMLMTIFARQEVETSR